MSSPALRRFNESKPLTEIDVGILRAREQPGPGDYNVDKCIDREKKRGGVRFGEGNPKVDETLPARFMLQRLFHVESLHYSHASTD